MQYYYSHDGANQQGPCTIEQLRQANITASTLVWHDGMAGWTPAGQVPELSELFQSAAAAAPNPASAPNPAGVPLQGSYVNYQTQYPAQVQSTNGMAVTSMVMGIVGIVTGCLAIPSILAIVFGHIARGQIRRGQGTGDGMALAGLIMGYIMTAITVVVIVFYVIMIIFAVGVAATSSKNTNSGFSRPVSPTPAPVYVPSRP